MRTVEELGELQGLHGAWRDLHAYSQLRNPYLHPGWQLTWARHFLDEGELETTLVFEHGELMAIAPMWRRRPLGRRVSALGLLSPLGSGRRSHLTELPGLLTARDHRKMTRAIVEHLLRSPALWTELSLSAEQGWLAPEWLRGQGNEATHFPLVKEVRPTVVLPLAENWEAMKPQLKARIKRNLRLGTNRLNRSGLDWEVRRVTAPGDIPDALDIMLQLNRSRSALDSTVRHRIALGDAAETDFYRDAIVAMAAERAATIYLLTFGGDPHAGVVVLHCNGVAYLELSGIDAEAWAYSPLALVYRAVIEDACARGDVELNLGTGPDGSKMRWSEDLSFQRTFLLARLSLGAAAALSAYQVARTARYSMLERARWRPDWVESDGAQRSIESA